MKKNILDKNVICCAVIGQRNLVFWYILRSKDLTHRPLGNWQTKQTLHKR